MKATELRQKDVAGVQAEVKALQKPTLVCVCKKPRNNSTTPLRCALRAAILPAPRPFLSRSKALKNPPNKER
jgi:hypothetical protein